MVVARGFVGLRPPPSADLVGVLSLGASGRGNAPRPDGIEHLLGFVPDGADAPVRVRHASAAMQRWLEEGRLVRDRDAGLDVLRLDPAHGPPVWGVVALLPVDDPRLHPHEAVVSGPADGRRLLRATLAVDVAPVMLLRRSASPVPVAPDALAVGDAHQDATDHTGVRHRSWRVTDPGVVEAVVAGLADDDVLVADGHHRLAAARAHAEQATGDPAAARAARWLLALVCEPDHAPQLQATAPVTDLEQVWHTALAGDVLPPKSTRFEPKPRAGLVLREHAGGPFARP